MKRRSCLISIAVLVVLLVAAASVYIWAHVTLTNAIDKRIQEARDAGLPTTLEELDAWYPQVPDEENAALLYLDAIDALRLDKYRDMNGVLQPDFPTLQDFGTNLPGPYEQLISEIVADQEDALLLVKQASSMRHSRYPVDLAADEFSSYMDRFRGLQDLLYVLRMKTLLNCARAESQEAVETLLMMGGIVGSLDNEPVGYAPLARQSFAGQMCDTLGMALDATSFDDVELTALQNALARLQEANVLHRQLVGAQCLQIHFYQKFGTDNVLYIWLHKDFLDILAIVVSAADESTWTYEEEAARLRQEATESRIASMIRSYMHVLVDFEHVSSTARIAAARGALAVERFRLATGALPERLEDLPRELLDTIPPDPFTGEPLRYMVHQDGYTVYSVGPNRWDNGGKHWQPSESGLFSPGPQDDDISLQHYSPQTFSTTPK